MKINGLGNRISTAIKTFKLNHENKFINKYCEVSPFIEQPVLEMLNPLRKEIAKFAKKRGIKVDIFDAEKHVPENFFITTQDYLDAKSAVKDKLQISVRRRKPVNNDDGSKVLVAESFMPKFFEPKFYYYRDLIFKIRLFDAIEKGITSLFGGVKK